MGLLDHFVVSTLPLVPKPIVARLSRPYIAGDNLAAAVQCIQELNKKGFKATLDVLGEFVTNFSQAETAAADYRAAIAAIVEHKLDANISVKPTSFGLLLDRERAESMIGQLMEEVARVDNFMRLDMEDSPCTTATIEMYDNFRKKHDQKVGVVLQAYMRRTIDDIEQITTGGPSHFRLCKGIYVEPEEIAYKGYQEIRENFMKSLEAMFDGGAFVGIATHDDYLVEQSINMVKRMGLGPDRYEFQMLLGVREKLRDSIHAQGHNLRIYVPYGKDWYGYSIRRLKENPSLAGTMFKAIFFGG
ncbi:MAG: proline dehydrogenase family protein [Acidobacteriota bacterium]|nr:proline dehydrogenase family protein [Acidobacteriota bacterium]